jgi:penicillin amidase
MLKRFGFALYFLATAGCALITSRPDEPAEDRLSVFPTTGLDTRGALSIRWDDHMVPMIEAEKDEDVPYALGLIHAHLRMNQLELMRRLSQGRVSEMAGPLTVDYDHLIRILNFGKSTSATIAAMPLETLQWAERFLKGLNQYIQRDPSHVPPDLRALGIDRLEPWTLEELVTAWKFASLDVNWLVYFPYLQLVNKPEFAKAWKSLIDVGNQSVPSSLSMFDFTKTGSNSIVIGKAKSKSGHGMIANDPHLGLTIPNLWFLVGYKSPSYRAIGLMIPSLPAIVVGRNTDIAWGGTNMWGVSTHLFQLSEDQVARAEKRTETIKVRDWLNREVTIRTTEWGPVISDSAVFGHKLKPTSLKWVGHEVSDELTSFLKANRAQSALEFRQAFATYAVSAQNLLVADHEGNIGHVLAIRKPLRPDPTNKDLLQPTNNNWIGFKNPTELPFVYNPKSGYIASANNKPVDSENDLGWFYQSSDRVRRWQSLADASAESSVDTQTLKTWQRDTFSESSLNIVETLVSKISDLKRASAAKASSTERDDLKIATIERNSLWLALTQWNGFYSAESNGPVAFECLMSVMLPKLLKQDFKDRDILELLARSASWKSLAIDQLSQLDAHKTVELINGSIAQAEAHFRRHATWGDMHRVTVAHFLSNLPLIGARYKFDEFGIDGGSDTLFKTATPLNGEKATSSFGTNARHISDLASLDENYFVLFGGQDGWLKSKQTFDQVALWRSGNYLQLPLSDEKIPLVFKRELKLTSTQNH